MPKNISAATLMVLSACIIWGAQPMFVTFVVREFDPIPLVSIRYFTVGVVLLAALAYSGEKLLPPRKAWLPLFLMGVLSVGGNNVAQFTGLQYSTVANLTIIASLTPAVTALLSLVLLHERLHKLQWLGIAASIIGAVYLISKGSLSTIINLNFNFGDILFCVSMVAWAFYTILVAQVSKYVSAYSAVAWAGLLGSLTTAAYSILTGQFALPYDLSALAWGSYFTLFYRQPGRYAVLEQRHPRYRPQSGRRVYESDAVSRHHLRHRLSRRKLLYFRSSWRRSYHRRCVSDYAVPPAGL